MYKYNLKSLIVMVLVLLLSVSSPLLKLEVKATDTTASTEEEEEIDNLPEYWSWKQGDSRWGSEKIGNSTSKTIAGIGCLLTSVTLLLNAAGVVSVGNYTPSDLNRDLKAEGAFFSGGALSTSMMANHMDAEQFKFGEDSGQSSGSASIQDIKDAWNSGLYVSVCFYKPTTHWVAVREVKANGDIMISEVGSSRYDNTTTLEQRTKDYGSDFTGYRMITFIGSKPSTESGSISTDSIIELNGQEGYIDPMTGQFKALMTEIILDLPDEIAVKNDLSVDEYKSLKEWQNIAQENGSIGFVGYVRQGVIILGILLLIWVLFLYLAYWFDRVNNFIELSMLPILTVGGLRISPEESECTYFDKNVGRGMKTVNHKAMLLICGIGVFVGMFVVSGMFFETLNKIVLTVRGIF